MSAAVEDAISAAYLREIVERLESFRSHPLGFRVAGTPEERAATGYLAGEMRDIGLEEVVEEPVPVDAWRLRDAFAELGDGTRVECASMGGVPETGRRGVRGQLVFVGRGDRRALEDVDVRGKVALVDWSDQRLWPYDVGLELGLRGAAAMVLTSFPGGPYFQADGALGTFDSIWHPEGPPMVTMRKEDAARLRKHEGEHVRVVLVAPLTRGAEGANVVGVLPGRRRGPILVGGHHDGWFGGAFDDATGVAVTLGLARALLESGYRPRHSIAFISHTAEEYGIVDSRYEWCYGAWYQIVAEHREWASRAPFYLNVEGSGLRDPLVVDPPPELRAWSQRICRRAESDGLLQHGWKLDRPNTWTEVWPFLAAGVPGINVSTFTDDYDRTLYHTQYDTSDRVDFDYLATLTRVFARFVLEADADPDGILDYGARARELTRVAPELDGSIRRLGSLEGRSAFTALGRGLYGLDAGERAAYPHEQPRADLERLERGLAAVRAGKHGDAVHALERVGLNQLTRDLSEEAFRLEHVRRGPRARRLCWAAQGVPAPGPNLWPELASLRGEPGARKPGQWLERSLENHVAGTRRDLGRRLARMRAALEGRVRRLPEARL